MQQLFTSIRVALAIIWATGIVLLPIVGKASSSGNQPGRAPKYQGALEYVGKKCEVTKNSLIPEVKIKVCTHWLGVPTTAEMDPRFDYGIVWSQGRFDPARFCARRFQLQIFSGGGFEYLARIPTQSRKLLSARRVNSRLQSDAENHLLPYADPPVVEEVWTLQEGELSKPRQGGVFGEGVRWEWKGDVSRAVDLVVGVLVRWKTEFGLVHRLLFQRSVIEGNVATGQGVFREFCMKGRP